MKASYLRRKHSRRTAAHLTRRSWDRSPHAPWQRWSCSGTCLVVTAELDPASTPLGLFGVRDGKKWRTTGSSSKNPDAPAVKGGGGLRAVTRHSWDAFS